MGGEATDRGRCGKNRVIEFVAAWDYVTFVRLFYSNRIAVMGSEVLQLNKKRTLFLRPSQWESPACSSLSLHANLALAFATA